jgi:dihydrofolate synthase / folylpolyglutamate synthase
MDSYSETLNRIYNLRGGVIDLRLDRMDRALALFDHPEKQFRSFHIAGTNGKGSTAAMLHRILSLAGYRTALYTSPHLVSFTERIRVENGEISRAEVIELADEVHDRTAMAELPLTFFEFVTVMAFIYFARQQVEVAVVEVGLGGRLDATNLVSPIVSMITTISKDHEAYLGSDLLSIAREKGGIIKAGVPVVIGAVPEVVADLLVGLARDQDARAYILGREYKISLKNTGIFDYTGVKQNFAAVSVALWGRHQRNNAGVALAALEIAGETFPVNADAVREGLRTVTWPGRFEIMMQSPTVILDGAHNGEGVKALLEALREYPRRGKVKLLFASMEDKDWRLMLNLLEPVVDEAVLTRVQMDRSADPNTLSSYLTGRIRHRVIEDSRSALRSMLDAAHRDEIVLVAGSLYLLGEVRPVAEEVASQIRPA